MMPPRPRKLITATQRAVLPCLSCASGDAPASSRSSAALSEWSGLRSGVGSSRSCRRRSDLSRGRGTKRSPRRLRQRRRDAMQSCATGPVQARKTHAQYVVGLLCGSRSTSTSSKPERSGSLSEHQPRAASSDSSRSGGLAEQLACSRAFHDPDRESNRVTTSGADRCRRTRRSDRSARRAVACRVVGSIGSGPAQWPD